MAEELNENIEQNENENDNPATPDLEELQRTIAKLTSDNEKLKAANTKASADASRYKKEWQSKQTEAEREAQEKEEAMEALRTRLAELERANTVSTYENAYISMGYSKELANRRAELMADGKVAEALEVEKEFLVAHDKELGASATKGMSKPPLGSGSKHLTKQEIMAIKDPAKRREAIAENIELFT